METTATRHSPSQGSVEAMSSQPLFFRPIRLFFALSLFLACTSQMAFAVDFATQVHPILASRCQPCHGGDKPQAGLSFASRSHALQGGASGPALTPGNGKESLLIQRVSGHKGQVMPPTGDPLTPAQISILQAWIDEGAVWPETKGAPPADQWVAPIAPRKPEIPQGTETNPIDRFVAAYLAKNKVKAEEPVSDSLFARRVYFDLWGIPPTPEQLETFIKDRNPKKREQLVDTLLSDSQKYTAHWITWWNDVLRNDVGVNYAGERKSITGWLKQALNQNYSFDRMINELINPAKKEDPDGFLVGVNWRGDVNASQTPYMQAAQNTAQIFLGINLKCASCHDSFVNRYKLKESYGMAALFAPDSKLELVRCDVKTGKFTGPSLLYSDLGSVPENATLADRHAAAARFFTDPRNGRVPRTIVNRYWQKLFGRGLVEPVDDMDAKPWNDDLLDWMASDFTAHGNDLKYLLKTMMTSKAYQMPSVVSKEQPDTHYVFQGPQVRRLSAEEFIDAVSAITGEWRTLQTQNNAILARDWEVKSSSLTTALGRPIRDQVFTTRDNRATTFQALELVNGETLADMLRRGSRRLLGTLPPAPENLFDSHPMRKGTVAFDVPIQGAKQLYLLLEDAGSYDPTRTIAGWADVELSGPRGTKKLSQLATISTFKKEPLTAAKLPIGQAITVPVGSKLVFPIEGLGFTRIRGRVAIDDRSEPSDIGGSVRFFIFTNEPDHHQLVKVSGTPPVPFPAQMKDVDDAIHILYLHLFAREPNDAEIKVAREFFSAKGKPRLAPDAMEDFLWSMLLHPDFQYLY